MFKTTLLDFSWEDSTVLGSIGTGVRAWVWRSKESSLLSWASIDYLRQVQNWGSSLCFGAPVYPVLGDSLALGASLLNTTALSEPTVVSLHRGTCDSKEVSCQVLVRNLPGCLYHRKKRWSADLGALALPQPCHVIWGSGLKPSVAKLLFLWTRVSPLPFAQMSWERHKKCMTRDWKCVRLCTATVGINMAFRCVK